MSGQTSTHGAGQFGPKVEGEIFLLLVEQSKLSPLISVDDGEDLGDGFTKIMTT